MAVEDLWTRRDGSPSARSGKGARWRVSVRGYPSTSHRTKAEAERVHAERVLAGPPVAGGTVGECLDVWLAGKRGLASEVSYKHTASLVRARWGHALASRVAAGEVQVWLAELQSQDRKGGGLHPASASTRLKALQGLRGALAVAVDRGWIERDPTGQRRVRVPKVRAREPRYLTVQQLRALAEASSHPASVWVMGTCGPRSSEVARLQVGDVVRRRGGTRLRIRQSKNGDARDVPVSSTVLAMLDLGRSKGEPLLTAPEGGPLSMRNWRARVFDPAVEAVGLDGLRPHDLRHTAVSLAIAAGADIKVVQRIAGHRTGSMTVQVYGHLLDDTLDSVAARMDALLEGAPT